PGTPRLQVRELTRDPQSPGVSLEVRAGEVVGIAGLVGSGRSSLAKAIAGIAPATRGKILIDGHDTRIHSVADAHRAGVAYVPEDRVSYGLLRGMSVEHNITLGRLDGLTRHRIVAHDQEHRLAAEFADRMGLLYSDLHQPVNELSGGNQQKVLLARWLAFRPSVLILDEPTQGIDVGVRTEIHRLIRELARDDIAVLVISSELDELLEICDRVVVMRAGRLIAERVSAGTTASDLVRLVSAEGASAASEVEGQP
ncbi:MAG TPA: ATP-binding cassette domain-containing protein, partial [Polyangiaceae bacterium]|nr:ATP-binding cassette domain-containing protein [Polyangiaceae bacterium]